MAGSQTMHDKHMARHADIMKRAGEHEAKAAMTKSYLDLMAGHLKTAHAESAKHVQAIADLKKSGDAVAKEVEGHRAMAKAHGE